MPRPSNRTLLLTIDAFETIFHPRDPVPVQYAKTAHAFGLPPSLTTPSTLKQSFKTTFKAQSALRPNYGRDSALSGHYGGPRQWWEEVIRGSFAIALGTKADEDARLPEGLVGTLLDRFAGREAYALYPDVCAFFDRLRAAKTAGGLGVFDRLVVGVVSNSDDRVPDILKSLGLAVGMTRADRDVESSRLPGFEERSASASTRSQADGVNDIDLVITSYDAGAEKPSPLIFEVAKRQAESLVAGHNGRGLDWTCVHVGDHYDKDYRAAIQAGWDGFFLSREGQTVAGAKSVNSLVDLVDVLERYQ